MSLPTIRRDLSLLHKRGQLVRSHGGAKKIQNEHIVAPLDFRKTINSVQKRRLCQAASKFVDDNDIVFVDASTTTLQLAESLPETQIRKTAIAQSKKTVFLCDESKLNLSAPFNLVPIQRIDYIVTNSKKLHELFGLHENNVIVV